MVTTNDDDLAARLRLLRNLAFTSPRFRHEVAGYNFRMTGYQGALGLSQFRRIEQIISEKRRVALTYKRHLAGIRGLRLPVEMEWARNVYWMFAVVIEPEFGISRDALALRLRNAGIETRTFFCGMNQQPFLRHQPGYREIACPVADRLWERGLYLPSGTALDEPTLEKISGEIRRAAGS
jgi:perosamine synthetase